ncbi:Protein of unknown function [Lachnospiraceae bacterium NE2001]|nr:Protein of unknown function [Lachnospiraceae bacterium NE2001]
MSHLTEYVKWRGDISLEERELTIIDNLVLCQLGYLDLKPIWDEATESLTLREAVERLNGSFVYKLAVSSADDDAFTRACAESERFGTLRITDYVDIVSPDSDEQFAALTFSLSDERAVIVFRGTDDTIVGWKEDFMLSYTRVPAQAEALKYAERIIQMFDHSIVAGHSKGANLALYATAYMDDSFIQKVDKIYLNDGPGFCEDILDTHRIDRIKDKAVRITPEFCVVGGIFEPDIPQNYVVGSSGRQLLQHDLQTWEIEDGQLQLLEKHDDVSEKINQVFDKFIEKMDMANREAFVKRIFDTMSENGAVTISDFMNEGIGAFENLLIQVVGKSEFDINPVQNIGKTVIQDIKESQTVKKLEQKALTLRILRIGLAFLMGIMSLCFPGFFMKFLFTAMLLAVIVFEVFQTGKHLKESGWDLKAEKPRAYICICLIVLFTLIHAKEGAVFILASGLFGLNFIIIAYRMLIQFKASKGIKRKRLRYFFEVIISFVDGVYILFVPEVADRWYMLITGCFLIMDSIFELISLMSYLLGPKEKEWDILYNG